MLEIRDLIKKEWMLLGAVMLAMLVYFLLAKPQLMDDGIMYEGFTQSLAGGILDFKTFYGFQGLSILAVPIYLVTHSQISIVITSLVLSLFSIPLAYFVGKKFWQSQRAGWLMVILFLLTPYPYTTVMRGFQETALLFFVLLIIYGTLAEKFWTPLAWAFGGLVKPFALVLLPLFGFGALKKKNIVWWVVALAVGGAYLGLNYYQTGHFVNNAAIGSYQGAFNTNEVPALATSFQPSVKSFGRVVANLLFDFRKVMVPASVIIFGIWSLLFQAQLKKRKEIALALLLNFILVGSLTFSFAKYLLPITTLLSLLAIGPFLMRPWLMIIVAVDSLFVFLSMYQYFGHVFWSSFSVYLTPLYIAIFVMMFIKKTPAVQPRGGAAGALVVPGHMSARPGNPESQSTES